MTRLYQDRLDQYGLTHEQYSRAVAAHELAHALVANARPTTASYGVEVRNGPRGVHGFARTGPARGAQTVDRYDRAVLLEAGAIAKAHWLKTAEGLWSPLLASLVHATAAGDRQHLDNLGLPHHQREAALRDACAHVGTVWPALASGVPVLAAQGTLTERQVANLNRTSRTRRALSYLLS